MHIGKLIALIRAKGYSILLNEKQEYKFRQSEFEGVETIILHPLKAVPIQLNSQLKTSQGATINNYGLGRYLSYHILTDDKTLHIFFDIPSIIGWLDSMEVAA